MFYEVKINFHFITRGWSEGVQSSYLPCYRSQVWVTRFLEKLGTD